MVSAEAWNCIELHARSRHLRRVTTPDCLLLWRPLAHHWYHAINGRPTSPRRNHRQPRIRWGLTKLPGFCCSRVMDVGTADFIKAGPYTTFSETRPLSSSFNVFQLKRLNEGYFCIMKPHYLHVRALKNNTRVFLSTQKHSWSCVVLPEKFYSPSQPINYPLKQLIPKTLFSPTILKDQFRKANSILTSVTVGMEVTFLTIPCTF